MTNGHTYHEPAELSYIVDDLDIATVRDRVMPLVKPLSLLTQVRKQQLPMLAYRPLIGDLMVAYMIDQEQRKGFLNEDHLRRYSLSETELYEQALNNLRAKAWVPHPGVLGAGRGALLILNSRDGYDATRVLLPEIFSDFQARLPGTLVIGIPNRDFLIAFSDVDQRVAGRIVAQIQRDAQSQSYALTAQLLTLHAGQLALYERPPGEQ